ncbi:MAG: ABC transporter permease [Chitinophagaceae bacterium]
MSYLHSFQSEWLKTKRSAAAWLTLAGGLFIPIIILTDLLLNYKTLPVAYTAVHFWERHFSRSWQFMAFFLLPVGVILASSLIAQLEFRNNAWKQVLTTPQQFTTIFFSKLLVIIVMMLQFFVLFSLGIYGSAIIPAVLLQAVPFPAAPLHPAGFLKTTALFFIDCLPIISLQYLLSLQFKNFLVPIGIGLAIFMAAVIANSWKYVYLNPYSYCMVNFSRLQGRSTVNVPLHTFALSYFLLFVVVGFVLFIQKKEKG